jgi:hypothetical protein
MIVQGIDQTLDGVPRCCGDNGGPGLLIGCMEGQRQGDFGQLPCQSTDLGDQSDRRDGDPTVC